MAKEPEEDDWEGESPGDLKDVGDEWEPKIRKMETIEMDIWDVTLNPENLLDHDSDQLKLLRRSYKAYGVLDDVIVDQNNVVVHGHGRVSAMRQKPPKNTKITMKRVWFDDDLERDKATAMLNESATYARILPEPALRLIDRIQAPLEIGMRPSFVSTQLRPATYQPDDELLDTSGLVGDDAEAGLNDIRTVKLMFDMAVGEKEYLWLVGIHDIKSSKNKTEQTLDTIRMFMEWEQKAKLYDDRDSSV